MPHFNVTPFSQARELEIEPLELELVNFSQLRRIASTSCPCCGEYALVLDTIEIQLNNSPADLGDLNAQHAAFRNGQMSFSGVFEIVCVRCDDFAQTGFLYVSAPPVHKDDVFVQA